MLPGFFIFNAIFFLVFFITFDDVWYQHNKKTAYFAGQYHTKAYRNAKPYFRKAVTAKN